MLSVILSGGRVAIRRPSEADQDEFLAMVRTSREFHHPWVDPPSTPERFEEYLKSREGPGDDGFFICHKNSGAILGVVNLNCIVRRLFQSAYLGYYIGAEFVGRGFMTEGLPLVAKYAFGEMNLHRLEANIQPENLASIAVVKKCGFRKEGFSPRYLKIAGEWRDHERWALLADELG